MAVQPLNGGSRCKTSGLGQLKEIQRLVIRLVSNKIFPLRREYFVLQFVMVPYTNI